MTEITDPWTADDVVVNDVGEIFERLENYQQRLREHDVPFDLFLTFEIMRVDPLWLIDERTIELLERYMFFRQNPSLAFPGGFEDQPCLWVDAKVIIDRVLGVGNEVGMNPVIQKEQPTDG